ncbi:hypothetical protein WG66_008325 [Moniliophthora roreri]|nr:hypothetical protein WG66_008325 [Moniliophthora roreri]
MNSVNRLRLLDGLDKDEKLRKSTADMHEEAIELKKGPRRFDEEASYTYYCNHDQCPWEKRKHLVNFKRCTNCGIPTYCCRECQKANWSMHKHHCRLAVGPTQGYTYALSYLDHGFIRYLSSIHLDLRRQGLKRLVASNTTLDAVLAITSNYSVYPTQVLVDVVNRTPEKIECCLQHIKWQAEERFWGQELGMEAKLSVLISSKES